MSYESLINFILDYNLIFTRVQNSTSEIVTILSATACKCPENFPSEREQGCSFRNEKR